jgi:hypothetical protein
MIICHYGHDYITDFQATDFLKFTGVLDINNDNVTNVQDVLAQSHIVNHSGYAQAVFDNGATIDFGNVNFTGQATLMDILPANHVVII